MVVQGTNRKEVGDLKAVGVLQGETPRKVQGSTQGENKENWGDSKDVGGGPQY